MIPGNSQASAWKGLSLCNIGILVLSIYPAVVCWGARGCPEAAVCTAALSAWSVVSAGVSGTKPDTHRVW